MKAPFSAYLNGLRGGLKELIALLRQDYDYVSVLATDSKGLAVRISQRSRSVSSETMTTERGIVVRVCRDGQYSEYALNSFDPARSRRRRGGQIRAELASRRPCSRRRRAPSMTRRALPGRAADALRGDGDGAAAGEHGSRRWSKR